jgi:hypothetical protein
MFLIVVIFGALIAMGVLPLMFVGRALGAERTGFWWALLVLLVQGALSQAGDALVGNAVVAFALAFLAGALAIKAIFMTTYGKALLISAASTLLTFLGELVLARLLIKLLGGGHHSSEGAAMLASEAFRVLC